MISINGVEIAPTIFPDKTSQVWHLSDDLMGFIKENEVVEVTWEFENEGELAHVLQLSHLIRVTNPFGVVRLVLPYLPYARQDKEITNESTFALHSFLRTIEFFYHTLTVFDPHSKDLLDMYFPGRWRLISPVDTIKSVLAETKGVGLICYPDQSASKRYDEDYGLPHVIMSKVRDQSTGEILGMTVDNSQLVEDKIVLMVDDLADGARTFIEASKILYDFGAKDVWLYVSHALFTKGVDVVYDSGITKIYDKNGLFSEKRV